jgi:hypothetical protein
MTMTTTRSCTRCHGSGLVPDYPSGTRVCRACEGDKVFSEPVWAWFVEALTKPVKGSAKGAPAKRQLRRSRSKLMAWVPGGRSRQAGRLAYVFRMIEFHAGWDVRLPMCADLDVIGDPWVRELDDLALELVRVALGRSSIGAGRWRGAMTGEYGERGPGLLPTGTEGGFEVLSGKERT